MKTFDEVCDYIEESYRNNSFDLNDFEFYKTRLEKRNNSVGIINWNNNKYFFKIVKQDEYNDEEKIKNNIMPYFRIVNKYSERKIDDLTLNLYEYIDAPRKNAFNYLRNKDIPLKDKENKLENFFNKKIEFMNKTSILSDMTHTRASDRWFYGRINNRFDKFYGSNVELLLDDIKNIYEKGYINYKTFFTNIFKYLQEKHKTIESYCHGDFHDFNFSLEGLFWDIDTFGINPILNDFTVYYWHFYAREDTFVYKYSPWLTNYMYDNLTEEQLYKVRKLKERYILNWFDSIESLYRKHNIIDGLNDEFIFKLFCRIFLISDILEYEQEDRLLVYEFFNYYLENKILPLKELLFENPVIFPFYKKQKNDSSKEEPN